jgi:uroporphyrinogen-III synthase
MQAGSSGPPNDSGSRSTRRSISRPSDQIVGRIAVPDALIEIAGDVMRGSPDQLDAALMRLMIWPRALEARQVMCNRKFAAYHRRRPCANPDGGGRMNNRRMALKQIMADRLNGYRILILESREEAQFSRLLAEQGADVLQCPMFAIQDAPDAAPIDAWLRRFIEQPCDDLVLMTGEGLRRLIKAARRIDLEQDFIAALGKVRKYARGPKPGRALRDIGLEPQLTTEKSTSEGVAEMLSGASLRGHRLGLQLYPDKDHSALIGVITAQGAEVDPVSPYVYDAQTAEANILGAIDEMARGAIDAIALTNLGQVRRLMEVAQAHGCKDRLRAGLDRTAIASVGPVVSNELRSHGLRTDIYPANDAYFIRPLISAMAAALTKTPPRSAVSAGEAK